MKKITNADRVDSLFMEGTIEEARVLFDRAAQIMKIRDRLSGGAAPLKRGRKPKAQAPPPIAANGIPAEVRQ